MKYLIAVLCSVIAVQFAPAAYVIRVTTPLATLNSVPENIGLSSAGGANSTATSPFTIDPGFGDTLSRASLGPVGGSNATLGTNGSSVSLSSTQQQALVGSSLLTTFSSLNSAFTLTTTVSFPAGYVFPFITITITQDAYTFSSLQNQVSTSFTVLSNQTGSTVTHTASAGSSSITLSNLSVGTSASTYGGYGSFAGGGANPTSIVQTFTLFNVKADQSFTFTNAFTSISTPLPATALALIAGLPVLALARRRLFA
jgi:hypothetical protein